MVAQQITKVINFFSPIFFYLQFLVLPGNFVLFDQTIKFANDLSWQKIFRVAQRIGKWKNRVFYIFKTLMPYFVLFPDS